MRGRQQITYGIVGNGEKFLLVSLTYKGPPPHF